MVYDGKSTVVMMGGDPHKGSLYPPDPYIWEYDIRNKAWTKYDAVSGASPRGDGPLASIGDGKLLRFGGTTFPFDKELGETWLYDIPTRTWTKLAPEGERPSARNGHLIGCGSGKAVLFGGLTGAGFPKDYLDGTFLNDTWEFDLDTRTWKAYPQNVKPTPRTNAATSCVDNRKVMLFGGVGGSSKVNERQALNDLWEYDLETHTWTEISQDGPKPSPRHHHVMAYAGNSKLILFGGLDAKSEPIGNETWEYDIQRNTWTKLRMDGAIPLPRNAPGMAQAGEGRIVMFGGGTGHETPPRDDTWEYDAEIQEWTMIHAGQTSARTNRHRSSH